MGKRLCVVLLIALLGLGSAVPASAAAPSISKYQPVVGDLTSSLRGTRTVYMQPLVHKDAFQPEFYKTVVAKVKTFWQAQVPGMKLNFVLKTPKKTTIAIACGDQAAWRYAQKVSKIYPRNRQHLMAWGVQCGTGGMALVGGQYGYSGSDVQELADSVSVLAHELGHNFGFDHATGLVCNSSSGREVAFSNNCWEMPYGNRLDVMGGPYSEDAYRLSGFERLRISTRSQIYAAKIASKPVFLGVSGVKGKNFALAQSSYGPFLFDVVAGAPGKPASGVQINVKMKNGNQATIKFPDPNGLDPSLYLMPGQGWSIPGTKMRIIVTSVTSKGATVKFTAIGSAPKVTLPVVQTKACLPDQACEISWAKGTSSSGIASYQVEVQGELGPQLPATTTKVSVVYPADQTLVDVRVRMNTVDGFQYWSAMKAVSGDWNPTVDIYVNGVLVQQVMAGADSVTLTYQRGMNISWRIAGGTIAEHRTWTIGASTSWPTPELTWSETTLPAGTTSWTLPDNAFYGTGSTLKQTEHDFVIKSGELILYFAVDSF